MPWYRKKTRVSSDTSPNGVYSGLLLAHLKPTASFPIPEPAHTVFYVLTDSGILEGGALENDLGYGRHPLSPLFHAGHEVISQLRLTSEADT